MKTNLRQTIVLAVLALWSAGDANAQARAPQDLTQFTIEDLMNITVTSASRKQERADEVAAAIYVITNNDIRRSGMTTVPDLLRLVPGVQVAQINANKWAVSVRGFNGQYSNKLLVLVDGRSVYNHLYSGVLWDMEDLMVEDIDRIEVIRGPGAAVWGANAVNGVINILTRSAAETKGALVRAGAGTLEPGHVGVRYGGAFGNTAFRVYSQSTAFGDSRLVTGQAAGDRWNRSTAGFRGDWTGGLRAFTLQGRLTRGAGNGLWLDFDPRRTPDQPWVVQTDSEMSGGSIVARWTQTRENGASFQVQSFLDFGRRDEPVGDYRRRTADVDFQYHTKMGARQELVVGAGYRQMHEEFAGRNGYSVTPEASDDDLVNVFAQDEIRLAADRLHLTVGAKVERDSLAGWSAQPTARVTWIVSPKRQYLWAASSRAIRTPSLVDRGLRVDFAPIVGVAPLPIRVSLIGTPNRPSEVLADVETGYRIDIAAVATVAVTGFYGRYENLTTAESADPVLTFGGEGPYLAIATPFGSLLTANTRGLEVDAHWSPVPRWRLDASFTAFHLTPHLDAASRDVSARTFDGDASGTQWQVHSGLTLGPRTEIDTTLFRVGALKGLKVPAYTRVDARLSVPLAPRLTASFVGQNLFDALHVEYGAPQPTTTQTLVRRSAGFQLTWRY